MSEESTPIDARFFAYIAAHARPEDAFIQELKRVAVEAGVPPIWVAPEQAAFMRLLLEIAGAREVVEVGTLAGTTAIALARALPEGGRLRTIEVDETRVALARAWIARSDVADRVEVIHGDAAEVLGQLEDASLDALFIDADKTGYDTYLDEARRLLQPGGLLLCDNAFAFGHLLDPEERGPEVSALRAFNDRLAADPDFDGVLVPLGDGLWVARRIV
jgi:caffeoyl-CoA O-methyltransferase